MFIYLIIINVYPYILILVICYKVLITVGVFVIKCRLKNLYIYIYLNLFRYGNQMNLELLRKVLMQSKLQYDIRFACVLIPSRHPPKVSLARNTPYLKQL